MLRPALVTAALLLALPVSAQIYQWKDADGRTHYSDTPPPTGPVKTLRGATPRQHVPLAPAADAEDAADSAERAAADGQPADGTDENPDAQAPDTNAADDVEAQFRARRAAAAAAEQQATAEAERNAERERFCTQARNQLKGLQSGQRVARMNAAGEREFLTDEERSVEISRLERQLTENCD